MTLWTRLADHVDSVTEAENLGLPDFECRYLGVRSAWQGTAETYLLRTFRPVWNKEVRVCFGFGKHGDAAETRQNKRSPWDTVHPGRQWAAGSRPNDRSAEEIIARIAEHFAIHPPSE